LYLIDGSRALRAAIERHASQAAFLQRCQVNKIRNVPAYLPEAQQHTGSNTNCAWLALKLISGDVSQVLYRLHDVTERGKPQCRGQPDGGFGGDPHVA
jgi:hypothetical protein